jgi:hypothetical protein
MTGNTNLLNNYKHFEGKQFIIIENRDKMDILGSGSINLFFKKHFKYFTCKKL